MYLFKRACLLFVTIIILNSIETIDSFSAKPNIILITPNLFRISTEPRQQANDASPVQYVAIINKAHERDHKQLRQTYPKLVLQIRDARQPIAGQLFYEHVFDYFEPNHPSLLLPINLENVSLSEPSILLSDSDQNNNDQHGDAIQYQLPIQQVIVSIRPYQLNAGFGSDSLELVSSAPIPLERVASSDGFRNFAFIQTDKPIYKPEEKVRIRALILNELMKPIASDDIKIQVRNPHNIIVEEKRYSTLVDTGVNYATNSDANTQDTKPTLTQGDTTKQLIHNRLYLDHEFDFPPEPMLGIWTAQILHQDRSTNDSVTFEVKEYVLPTFKIDFSSPKYILPSTKEIDGSITVKYHYGKPVKGKAFFKFGYKILNNPQIVYIGRSLIKTIEDNGTVSYKFSVEKIKQTQWYPGIAGARFVVEASISEHSTGYHEVGTDTSCMFLSSPYKISLENSIDDFKPGIKQKLTAELIEFNTDKPAPPNLKVTAHYTYPNGTVINSNSDSLALTDSLGRVSFNVGPLSEDIQTMHVTLRWTSNNSSILHRDSDNSMNYEQTTVMHTMSKHSSNGGWILIMNKGKTSLGVGEVFQSDIMMRNAVILPKKIFYIIVSRGLIMKVSPLDMDGFIRFTATQEMVPHIRLVLFGLSGANDELVSDSMKLTIKQPVDCGLKLSYMNNQGKEFVHSPWLDSTKNNITVKPNEKGKLVVTGNIGDHVSLIGIDNGVQALRKNANHLMMPKIVERLKPLDTGCGFGGGRDNMDVFSNAGLMVFSDVNQASLDNHPADQASQQGGIKFINSNDIRDVIRDNTNPYFGSVCQSMVHQIRYNENFQRGYNKALIYYSRRLNSISVPRATLSNIEVGQRSGFNINAHDLEQNKKHNHRHKREVRALLRRHSGNEHDYRCCLLGTIYDLQKRNCSIRARIVRKYMPDNTRCQQVYLDCCRHTSEFFTLQMSSVIISGRNSPIDPSRVDESSSTGVILNLGELDAIESRTLVRQDFRETWLFDMVTITDSSKQASLDVQMPHSITTWSVSAMSMNFNRPICILSEPMRLVSFQDLFLHVSLPYKVVQGEQLDMVATVFNYGPQTRQVVVYTYGVDGVCSESDPDERSDRKSVTVQSQSSQSVLFPMIPLRVGKYSLKIVAASFNSGDAILKTLNVVARGSPVEDHVTFHLDPKNHQHRFKRAIETGNLVDVIDAASGLQRSRVRLLPSRNNDYIVPQTQECIVSAIGDKIGPTAQTTLNDVEHLIRLPHGCGEQVMIYLGPTLYTTKYLQTVGKLTGELRWKAIKYIQNGYKRVLNFRKEDGSFSAFVRRDSSIWLTAFITKMLCQTERTPFVSDQVHIDKHVIISGLKWLLKKQYPSTGMWVELAPVYHREMLGGVLKENTLTAFVVITLNECSHHSHELISEIPIPKEDGGNSDEERKRRNDEQPPQTNSRNDYQLALNRAEEAIFINKFKAIKERNAYVLALSAYALSFNRPHDATTVLNDLMIISNHNSARNWLNWRGEHNTETAGYALLALLELQPTLTSSSGAYRVTTAGSKQGVHTPSGDAQAIVNWLNSRRSFTGSFDSTQDTIVALEALSKYAAYQATPASGQAVGSQIDLMCNVTINNRLKRSIELRKENALVLQQFKLDSFNLEQNSTEILEFYTSGEGVGLMSVKLKYNILQDANELCRFDIFSTIEEWRAPIEKIGTIGANDSGKSAQGGGDEFFDSFNQNMLYELNVADSPSPADYMMVGALNNNREADNEKPVASSHGVRSTPKRVARFAVLRSVIDLVFDRSNTTTSNQSVSNTTHYGSRKNDHDSVDDNVEDLDWTHRLANSIGISKWFRGSAKRTRTTTTGTSTSTTTTLPPLATSHSERYTRMEDPNESLQPTVAYLNASISVTPSGAPDSESKVYVQQQLIEAATNDVYVNQSAGPVVTFPPMVSMNTMPSNVAMNNLSATLEIGNNQSSSPTSSKLAIKDHSSSRNRLVLLLKVCAQTLGRQDSEMAVIEVGILSGFSANEADLKEITANQPALKYELSPDKSLVIFYMEYIPFSGPYCMQFRLIREAAVTNLQSGHIRVYDYYQPALSSCSNFYTPTRFNDQLETKCDQMTGVCKCAVKSMCPKTHRLLEAGEIYGVNQARGREKFQQLVCSSQYDFVTLARLVNVRSLTQGQTYLLDVKPKHDLKGNLSRVIQEQAGYHRQLGAGATSGSQDYVVGPDHVTLALDNSCIKEDTSLLHFAHSKHFNQEGEYILIFGRWNQLEKRYAKRPVQSVQGAPIKPASGDSLDFSQNYPYTFIQTVDKDSIIFDIGFQTDSVKFKDNIKTLAMWLELLVHRDRWSCKEYKPASQQQQ